MSGWLPCPVCPHPLEGTVWEINDSKRRFVVVSAGAQYAYVENLEPPARRRRILLASLRASKAKHGYTQVTP